ncbi:hypothetical protein [Maritalea sp.]|uniref:hypothetical protein n=1 Tax=Maritalea sp. TaxID=2003361 RepID=UPI003EF608F9
MMNIARRKWLVAMVFALGAVFTAPTGAFAQQKNCLPHGEINKLVKSKQILSFNKITRIMGLKKGAKLFGQRLCEVDGQFVYFFKVVDAKGKALGVAVNANNGQQFGGNT